MFGRKLPGGFRGTFAKGKRKWEGCKIFALSSSGEEVSIFVGYRNALSPILSVIVCRRACFLSEMPQSSGRGYPVSVNVMGRWNRRACPLWTTNPLSKVLRIEISR
jgi:hypothetical protein